MTQIAKGQIYRSLNRPRGEPVRIKLVGEPVTTPGADDFGKTAAVTLGKNGAWGRRRMVSTDQLHATDTTDKGKPRRSGYVLETE
jgi:hypothetical protein